MGYVQFFGNSCKVSSTIECNRFPIGNTVDDFLTIRAFSVVYLIWYGTWTTSAKNIIQNFVTNLGSTAWWGINKAYGVGTVTFGKGADDSTYSQGKNLTNVWNVVQNAFNKALLPKDTNGIYVVVSSR